MNCLLIVNITYRIARKFGREFKSANIFARENVWHLGEGGGGGGVGAVYLIHVVCCVCALAGTKLYQLCTYIAAKLRSLDICF